MKSNRHELSISLLWLCDSIFLCLTFQVIRSHTLAHCLIVIYGIYSSASYLFLGLRYVIKHFYLVLDSFTLDCLCSMRHYAAAPNVALPHTVPLDSEPKSTLYAFDLYSHIPSHDHHGSQCTLYKTASFEQHGLFLATIRSKISRTTAQLSLFFALQ